MIKTKILPHGIKLILMIRWKSCSPRSASWRHSTSSRMSLRVSPRSDWNICCDLLVKLLFADACKFYKSPTLEHQGYAFAEYLDGGVTDQAIAGLNGMQVQFLFWYAVMKLALILASFTSAGRQEADCAARERRCQDYGNGQYPGSDTGTLYR